MKGLAQLAYDKRRFVLIGWIVGLVLIFVISGAVQGEHRTDFSLPGSESQSALDLLKAKGVNERTSGFTGQVVFRTTDGSVNDAAVKQRMEKLFADIKSQVANTEIVSPYDPANSYQISKDQKVAYAEINFAKRPDKEYLPAADKIRALRVEANSSSLQVELGGDLFAEQSEPSSEALGLLAAVIILLIAFGSVLAMGLPIVTALFGILTGTALIGITTRFLAVPEFTPLVAGMIGIGVGIDYSLLIVTRYRQALHDGMEPREAVTLAIDTSGRSVLFAGTVVVISLLGIFTMNLDFMRSMAIGAVLAVAMTMLSALTLLPALLGFVGKNIDRFGLPHSAKAEGDPTKSFWYKWSRVIQRHPWPALVVSTGILVLLTLPVFDLKLGFSDNGLRSTEQSPRRAYDLLGSGFGPGFNGPFLVVADTPNGSADIAKLNTLRDAFAATPGVASVTAPVALANGSAQLFNVFPTTGPRDEATEELVHKLRNEVRPAAFKDGGPKTYMAGLPPGVVDFADFQTAKLPIFFAAVLILSFILLMIVFHSVVVPLKAVIMNMLSIGASFGLTVAVFQWGVGRSLIGLEANGPFEAWAPMFLFSILFGLSMDYEVFLLTRVREEYDRTGDNGRAVADGLASTGRVISAAAAIMVCVFGAFILGDERAIKLMGFGLASAILIDATLVRLVLVPAAMELLGDRNWWAPAWLVKRLPTIRVDAVEHPVAPVTQYQRP